MYNYTYVLLFTQAELEKSMTRLKVEKAELVSELREEQAKSEMILDDLRKSNDVSGMSYLRYQYCT